MATIRKEALIDAAPAHVWDAVRDIGAIHTRLAPGFVVGTRLEPGARVVTFGNGMVARELIVTCDDAERRLVWSARSERLAHHNGAMQALDAGDGRTRLVWTADVLPDAAAEVVGAMMAQGVAAAKRTLEQSAKAA
jgi:carbon monoxide dehydrogenase subunit G